MQRIILVAAFVALTPLAHAQTSGNMGTRSNPGASGPPGSMNNMGGSGAAPAMTGQANPGNCGTPDEPKPCPSMPHRPPANRQ